MPRHILLVLIALSSIACAAPATKIEKVRWQDEDAYRLSNDKAEAIIVPAWRRVMHYSRLGEPNVLWTGAEKDYKGPPNAWPNYGGEKAWLWPQDEWTDAGGKKKTWPPPNDNSGTPGFTVMRAENGMLELQSANLSQVAAPMLRSYTLDESGALIIDTSIPVTGKLFPQRWAAWSVVQIPRPLRVRSPLVGDRRVKSFNKDGSSNLSVIENGNAALIDTSVTKDSKVGLDADALTAEYAGYSMTMKIDPAWVGQSPGTYDVAEKAQVYATPLPRKPGDLDYVELEFTSPRQVTEHHMPRMRVVLSIDRPQGR